MAIDEPALRTSERPAALLRRGWVLEGVTLGWNVAGIAVLAVAAVATRSGGAGRLRAGLADRDRREHGGAVRTVRVGGGSAAAGAAADRRRVRGAGGLPDGPVSLGPGDELRAAMSRWPKYALPGRTGSRRLVPMPDLGVMTGGRSYGSPGVFRPALTDKLRDLATRSRWPLPHTHPGADHSCVVVYVSVISEAGA
jgi:hypothetical protein